MLRDPLQTRQFFVIQDAIVGIAILQHIVQRRYNQVFDIQLHIHLALRPDEYLIQPGIRVDMRVNKRFAGRSARNFGIKTFS